MITLEQVVAMGLRHERVLERLSGALTNDLCVANPYLRRIAEHAAGFLPRYGRLPGDGDWAMWLDTLPDGVLRDGTREVLQRLYATDISGYHPDYFAEAALHQLRQGAVQVARARLNELTIVEPDAFVALAEKIQAVTLPPEARRSLWPTLAEVRAGAHVDAADDGDAEELIARLAWRGRHVMLAGLPKLGKSTFVGAGAVAFTRGRRFLHDGEDDDGGPHGRVLWLGMDEARGDAVSRLLDNGAMPMHVAVVNPGSPAAFLAATLRNADERPDVVVVDSLIEYARRTAREMPTSGDAAGWTPLVRQLTAWAHEYHVAIVTIHHARKSDGQYRDSTEILAAMDAALAMLEPAPKQDANVRRILMVGRRSIARQRSAYAVRLVPEQVELPLPLGAKTVTRDHYVLEPSEGPETAQPIAPSVRERIQVHVTNHPGCSQQALFATLGGDHTELRKALKTLVQDGAVREERRGKAYGYFPPAPVGLLEQEPGQLGNATPPGTTTPIALQDDPGFSALAAGENHTCGLTSTGTASCWGDNYYGQLGRGTFGYVTVPVAIASPASPASGARVR